VPIDKQMSLVIRLYGNDNFLEQNLGFKFGFWSVVEDLDSLSNLRQKTN
jgi:hypothetical protein